MADWLSWLKSRLHSSTADLSIFDASFLVLDTELTGLDVSRDSILSIGAIGMEGSRILLGESFYQIVKPPAPPSHESVTIHGITPSELEGKPVIAPVLGHFLTLCESHVIVGHYVALDISFIKKALRTCKYPIPATLREPAVDTLSLYHWLARRMPDREPFKSAKHPRDLYEIAAAFGVDVKGAHIAIADAFITAQLLQRMLPLLSYAGIRTVGGLRRAGDPKRGMFLSGEINSL